MNKDRFTLQDGIAIGLISATALWIAWLFHAFTPDDAFITYRYARNIAAGLGFVYNTGEAVLGTTTPLYTLLLALLAKLIGPALPEISQALSLGSLWIGGICLYGLLRKQDKVLALAASLFLVTNLFLLYSLGMETCFLIGLMLVTLLVYLNGKRTLAGLLLGLLILTRYEMAFFALIVAGYDAFQQKKLPFWVGLAAAPVIPWFIYAWATFGSIIPMSASAKLGAIRLPFLLGFADSNYTFALSSRWFLIWIPAVLLGIYTLFRRKIDACETILLLWSLVYGVIASFLAGTFPWYYGPLLPGLAILFGRGMEFLANFAAILSKAIFKDLRFSPNAYFGVTAAVVTGLVAAQFFNPAFSTPGSGNTIDNRQVQYRKAADWLRANSAPNTSLMTGEIGVLGYYSGLYIVDSFGLITPQLLPLVGRPVEERMTYLIDQFHPEYVLIRENLDTPSPSLATGYQQAQKFDQNIILYQLTGELIQ